MQSGWVLNGTWFSSAESSLEDREEAEQCSRRQATWRNFFFVKYRGLLLKADRHQKFSPAAGIPTEMCTHFDKLWRTHCCLGKVISSKEHPHSFQLHAAAALGRDHNPKPSLHTKGKPSHPFSTLHSSSTHKTNYFPPPPQSCPFYSPLLREGFPAPGGKLNLKIESSWLLGSEAGRSRWSMLCPGFPPVQI